MAGILTRKIPWTTQPQGAVLVDKANALVRAAGLKSVWSGTHSGRDSLGKTHGTLTNGPTVGVGTQGKAFVLDGVDDYVSFGTGRDLETSNNRVIAFAKVRRTGALADFSGVINSGKDASNAGGWMIVGTATNALRFYIWNGAWNSATSSVLTLNQWYDVCATWDGANMKIYLDGVLEATTAVTSITYPATVTQPANLGQYIADEFPGEIAIAGFGDGLLTDSQVKGFAGNSVWQIFEPYTRKIYVVAAGDVTVALTGVSTTAAVGALSPSISLALTGNQATASVGSVAPSLSVALSGVSASFAVGSVSPGKSLALTGVSAIAAVGSLAYSVNVGLTGVSATGQVGSLTPSGGDVVSPWSVVSPASGIWTPVPPTSTPWN